MYILLVIFPKANQEHISAGYPRRSSSRYTVFSRICPWSALRVSNIFACFMAVVHFDTKAFDMDIALSDIAAVTVSRFLLIKILKFSPSITNFPSCKSGLNLV